MAVGGQRLAKLLNSILVTNVPSLTSVIITNGDFVFTWGSVSGRVTDSNNEPVSGVMIASSANITAVTNVNGQYSLTGLMAGTHTIMPAAIDGDGMTAAQSITLTIEATTYEVYLPVILCQ